MHRKKSTLQYAKAFRALAACLHRYSKEFSVLLTFAAISGVVNGIAPYFLGKFFDAVTSPAELQAAHIALSVVFLVFLAWFSLQIVNIAIGRRLEIARNGIARLSREEYTRHFFERLAAVPFILRKEGTRDEALRAITVASWRIEMILGNVMIELLPKLLAAAIALSFAFVVYPMLVVAFAGIAVAILFTLSSTDSRQENNAERLVEGWNDAYEDAALAVANAAAIENILPEKEKKSVLLELFEGRLLRHARQLSPKGSVTQRILILSLQVIIFALSIGWIREGIMSAGQLLAFNAYLAMIMGPLSRFIEESHNMKAGLLEISGAEDLLEHAPGTQS